MTTYDELMELLHYAISADDTRHGHSGIDAAEGEEDWKDVLARVQKLANDLDKYRTGWRRYEIGRRLHPQQWAVCWQFSMEKGVPFDAVIDEQAEAVGVI